MFNVDTPMYRCPDGNVVQFWERPVQNKAASDSEGRPIFYKALMARIISPAMKTQTPDQRIYLKDESGRVIKRNVRYVNADTGQMEYWDDFLREQLKAWTEGRADSGNGTPLDSYPKLDVAQIAMLKALGVHFLEQLAEIPDSQLSQLGAGGRSLRDGVRAYIDAAKGNAPMEKLAAENAAMAQKIAEMGEQITRLTASHEPKRRGRPPQTQEAAE